MICLVACHRYTRARLAVAVLDQRQEPRRDSRPQGSCPAYGFPLDKDPGYPVRCGPRPLVGVYRAFGVFKGSQEKAGDLANQDGGKGRASARALALIVLKPGSLLERGCYARPKLHQTSFRSLEALPRSGTGEVSYILVHLMATIM